MYGESLTIEKIPTIMYLSLNDSTQSCVWNGMGWGAMKWSGIKLLFHCLDIFMMNWEKSGSVPYHSNWKGGKRRGVLGTEWNAFH